MKDTRRVRSKRRGLNARVHVASCVVLVAMLCAGAVAGQGNPKDAPEGHWARNFFRQGANARVLHLASTNDHLVITGDFDAVAGRYTEYEALWNGSEASPMGDTRINALGEFEGRPVGGLLFYRPGGWYVDVALWDGNSWQTIGEFDGYVSAFGTFEGKLVAAGNFSVVNGVEANSIATWDGSGWSPLGDGISAADNLHAGFLFIQGGIAALVAFDGDLYAAGAFIEDPADPMLYGVKRWNGSSWEFTPTARPVMAATVYDGRLLVGGTFTTIGGVSAGGLAEFDGASWSDFETPVPTAAVAAMDVYGDNLVIAGFGGAGTGVPLWRWDSTSWQSLGIALTYLPVTTPTVGTFSHFDGRLYAGGRFDEIGGVAADNIASWDGSSWSPLGSNGDGITRLGVGLCGWGDQVVAYGYGLVLAGDKRAGTAAAWDGKTWTPLGPDPCVRVHSMVDHGGVLVAGATSQPGCSGPSSTGLLEWNGNEWVETGGRLEPANRASSGTRLLDAGGLIYIGSIFDHAGEVAANNIAAWDGTAYHALGEGVTGPRNGGLLVQDMVQYRGDIVVAGDFTMAGTEAVSCIAGWDGSNWHALGEGFAGTNPDYYMAGPVVYSLAVYQGDLFAAGHFINAGDQVANGLARWDGKRWHSLGIEFDERPLFMTAFHGELVVDGAFTTIGGTPARYLAAWNGKRWREFGGGLPQNTGKLLSSRGSLFITAVAAVGTDNIVSIGIAQWHPGNSPQVAVPGGGALHDGVGTRPAAFDVPVNVPNPFNPETSIRFDLPRDARVRVTVYDAQGSLVTTLLDDQRPAGSNSVAWSGRDGSGRTVASGIYFVVVDAGDFHGTRKITLIK